MTHLPHIARPSPLGWARACGWLVGAVGIVCWVASPSLARQSSGESTDERQKVIERQQRLAGEYRQLEQKLFDLYDLEKGANPERSQLLQRAFQASQRQKTTELLQRIAAELEKSEFASAEKSQQQALADLEALLSLLQNEDAGNRIRDARKRNLDYLKEVERLQRMERSLRGDLENQGPSPDLQTSQEQIAERAAKLEEQIRRDEEPAAPEVPLAESPRETAEPSPPPDPNLPQSEPSPSVPTQPPSGSPEPPNATPAAPSDPSHPVRKRIEAAQQRMRDAARKIGESNQPQAQTEMQQAERELAEAKRELEEILKQMREEEQEYVLTLLEERFRNMLERQLRVNDQTQRLDKTEPAQRLADFEIACRKLSGDEREILLDADRALELLRDEGSSVALAETSRQLRDDIAQIAERLATFRTGTVTQDLQQDVVELLGHLIESLVQAKRDLEKDQAQAPQAPGQEARPGEEPLVNALAELRLIRSLQERVYKRHSRYAQMLERPNDPVGRADRTELREAIARLGEQQRNLMDVTRELERKARDE